MKIRDAIGQYIAWRQTHGTQFKSGSALLHCFLKGIDREISCDGVTEAQVRSFLGGKGPLTRYRANKYAALAGFYRYAISRGYANCSPLPDNEPKKPPVAPPYIYSHDELRRLFGAIDIERSRAIRLDAPTFRTLLLLLYGAGLRRTEALQLTLADVDLSGTVLTVRNSKFYRQRRAPRARRRGAAAMNLPNLPYLLVPHELSDEAAAYVSELLNDLAVAFDGQYFAQIRRYYDERRDIERFCHRRTTRPVRLRRRRVLNHPPPALPGVRVRWPIHLHHNHRDHRDHCRAAAAPRSEPLPLSSPTMTGQCDKSTSSFDQE